MAVIAPVELISPKYLAMQKELHQAPRGYGGRGDKWFGIVVQIAYQYRVGSILDYGCGEGSLVKALTRSVQDDLEPTLRGIRFDEYDPAMPGKDKLPGFADMVVCTDVLEHIEPERLDKVLAHLRMLARKVLWIVVSTKDSNKVLADGRNAHLIIKPGKWWKDKVREAGFTLHPAPPVVRTVPHKEWVAVLTP